jgi:signal transduction histidine kinase
VAIIIARWLDVHFESAPVSLFLCAIMVSAWLGGVGPGLVTLVLCVTAFKYYFVSPVFSLAVDGNEVPRLVIFVLAAFVVGSLSAAQRRATQSLRRAEEELRRMQGDLAHVTRVMTMGELTASIAHEVNQPLSAIVTNASACLRWLAGDTPNLEEGREAARRIIRDGNRASEVVARIRALTKKTGTTKERLDLNDAIQEVVALAQGQVRRNRVVLRTELAGNLPPVLGDRVQLQQVVLNLVMNGIEAMSAVADRPRELLIRTQDGVGSTGGTGDQVRVSVRDSGVGLDPAGAEKIFDAFYTTKSEGMGMGLSISRTIVEDHGGKLWAMPSDGPGATFQFTVVKHP